MEFLLDLVEEVIKELKAKNIHARYCGGRNAVIIDKYRDGCTVQKGIEARGHHIIINRKYGHCHPDCHRFSLEVFRLSGSTLIGKYWSLELSHPDSLDDIKAGLYLTIAEAKMDESGISGIVATATFPWVAGRFLWILRRAIWSQRRRLRKSFGRSSRKSSESTKKTHPNLSNH